MRPVKKPVEGRGILASNRMPPKISAMARSRCNKTGRVVRTKRSTSPGCGGKGCPARQSKDPFIEEVPTCASCIPKNLTCRRTDWTLRSAPEGRRGDCHAAIAPENPHPLRRGTAVLHRHGASRKSSPFMAPKRKTNGFRDLSTCMVGGERRYRLPYYLTSDRDARLGQVRVWRENAPEYFHPSWIQNGRSPILDPVISASAAQ